MQRKLVTTLAFLFVVFSATSQTQDRDALQKQRENLRKEIAETERALAEVRKTAKVNIGGLTLINKKIDLQGNVIDNISGEIKNLNNNIFLSQKEVTKMSHVLDTLKQEYAKSMVYAYKNRSNYDFLNFIFSAASFNDAIKRIAYLKSVAETPSLIFTSLISVVKSCAPIGVCIEMLEVYGTMIFPTFL